MCDGTVKNTSTAIIPYPRQSVVVVFADAVTAWLSLKFCFVGIDAEEHADPVPRIRLVDAKELISIFEILAVKWLIDRVVGIVEFNIDVLIAIVVVCASRAEHNTEFRPVFMGAGPACKGDRGPVDTEQPAAAVDKFEQTLP